MSTYDAREAVHGAARGASLRGSCNVLSCAFEQGGHKPICGIYCEEQVEAIRRAYNAGREAGLSRAEAVARAIPRIDAGPVLVADAISRERTPALCVETAPVVRPHCERCDRCGWQFSVTGPRDGCTTGNCSERPLPALRTHCAGCGVAFVAAEPTPREPEAGDVYRWYGDEYELTSFDLRSEAWMAKELSGVTGNGAFTASMLRNAVFVRRAASPLETK